MASTVNPQVVDAVTQANVKVLGEAPAMAMGNIYQTLAHSFGMIFENSVNAQQQQNIVAQAATTQGVMQIYALDSAAAAVAVDKIIKGNGANADKAAPAKGEAPQGSKKG